MFNLLRIVNKRQKKHHMPFTYEKFLLELDDLSATRLRRIDMAIGVIRSEFRECDFELSETCCYGPNVLIKRNQNGFYVDETKSLDSNENFYSYKYGLEFFEKNLKRFEELHKLLCDKECIMRGFFNSKRLKKDDLITIAVSLGYGSRRDEEIFEENFIHPSNEYKRLLELLKIADTQEVENYDDVIDECMDQLEKKLLEPLKIQIHQEYNDIEILIINQHTNFSFPVYTYDGISIRKDKIDDFFIKESPYIEVYFRIIIKCLKKKKVNNILKNSKKI